MKRWNLRFVVAPVFMLVAILNFPSTVSAQSTYKWERDCGRWYWNDAGSFEQAWGVFDCFDVPCPGGTGPTQCSLNNVGSGEIVGDGWKVLSGKGNLTFSDKGDGQLVLVYGNFIQLQFCTLLEDLMQFPPQGQVRLIIRHTIPGVTMNWACALGTSGGQNNESHSFQITNEWQDVKMTFDAAGGAGACYCLDFSCPDDQTKYAGDSVCIAFMSMGTDTLPPSKAALLSSSKVIAPLESISSPLTFSVSSASNFLTAHYVLSHPGAVTFRIFDTKGARVAGTYAQGYQRSGSNTAKFAVNSLAPGLYTVSCFEDNKPLMMAKLVYGSAK